MSIQPVVLQQVTESAPAGDGRPVISVPLFVSESFIGVLVTVEAGQGVALHSHEHKDEAFDVIEGEGTILVGRKEVKAQPGTLVFVPAGTAHGLRNDSAQRWLLRETVHERVYFRAAMGLLWQAFLKRLPLIGGRWRS